MTDTTPPPEKLKTPPDEPDDAGFSIRLVDNIDDNELKIAVKTLLDQNAKLTKTLEKMETEQRLDKYNKQLAEKLSVLKELDVRLFEKYKAEPDIGRLDLLIDTAKSFKNNFPEYKKENDKEAPKHPTHINPRTGKLE